MQKRLLMLLFGGVFLLLGLFTMPMRRANPRQNLVDNPFGWGLFGFGLSSLLIGLATKERKVRLPHSIEVKEVHVQEEEQKAKPSVFDAH